MSSTSGLATRVPGVGGFEAFGAPGGLGAGARAGGGGGGLSSPLADMLMDKKLSAYAAKTLNLARWSSLLQFSQMLRNLI